MTLGSLPLIDGDDLFRRHDHLDSLLHLFAHTPSRTAYLDAVVELIRTLTGCRCVGIRVLDRDGNIPYQSCIGHSEAFLQSENWLSIEHDQCICTRIISGDLEPQDAACLTPSGSYFCNNMLEFISSLSVLEQAKFRGACLSTGFASVAVVPFHWEDRILGAIHIADERPDMVPFPMVELTEALALIVGEAIHRFEVEEQLQRNYDTEAALNALLSLSLADLSLDEVLKQGLDLMTSIRWLAFGSGAIFLVEDDGATLAMKVQSGLPKSIQQACARVPFGRCLCGQAALSGQLMIGDHPDHPLIPPSEKVGAHDHYCMPIVFSGRTLGMINLHVEKERRSVASEDSFLSAMANAFASIIVRKQAEETIRRERELFQKLIESSVDGILAFDCDCRLTIFNPGMERISRLDKAEVIGKGIFDVFPFLKETGADQYIYQSLKGHSGAVDDSLYFVPEIGRRGYFDARYSPLYGESGEIIGGLAIIRDTTERKQAEAGRDRLITILEATPDFVGTATIDGRSIYLNSAGRRMLGLDDSCGEESFPVLEAFPPWGRALIRDEAIPTAVRDGAWCGENSLLGPDGREIPVSQVIIAHKNGTGNVEYLSTIARDITEHKKQQELFAYLATHDPLTGLPNRRSLEETLAKVVARARRGVQGALLFLDVDNFKLINDTVGHAAGDQALVILARLLGDHVRVDDVLARVGGDELAVVLGIASVEDAKLVAERMRRSVEEFRLTLGDLSFNLSLSIGLIAIDGSQTSPALVLSQADVAMYRAKELGGNQVVIYRPEDDASAGLSEANRLVVQLRDALRDDLFFLCYQPIVRLSDGEVEYYEALIRLQGASGEIILPGAFIPAAERFGMMPQLTRWIVRRAVETLCASPSVVLSVNLSGLDLTDDSLPAFVHNCLSENVIDPRRLRFEITETAVIRDMGQALKTVQRISAEGCRFALDDFGTGFVSFAYLLNLPVDQIKIGGYFISSLETDPTSRAVVQAVQTLAAAQGKEIVAECVENEALAQAVKQLGVTFGQGYFYGRPSALIPCPPAEEIRK